MSGDQGPRVQKPPTGGLPIHPYRDLSDPHVRLELFEQLLGVTAHINACRESIEMQDAERLRLTARVLHAEAADLVNKARTAL